MCTCAWGLLWAWKSLHLSPWTVEAIYQDVKLDQQHTTTGTIVERVKDVLLNWPQIRSLISYPKFDVRLMEKKGWGSRSFSKIFYYHLCATLPCAWPAMTNHHRTVKSCGQSDSSFPVRCTFREFHSDLQPSTLPRVTDTLNFLCKISTRQEHF